MSDSPTGPALPGGGPMRQLRQDLDAAERLFSLRDAPAACDAPLRRLLRVIEQLNASLDVDKVLRLAAAQIIDLFEAERVFVLNVLPDGGIRFRLGASFLGETVEHPDREVSHAVIRETAQGRRAILVRDATRDGRFANVSSVRNLQLHSVMAAPLLAGGELLGVVYADNRRLAGAFDEHTLDLLGLLANHIGIALHNAQLFAGLSAARAELAQAERLKAVGQMASYIVHEIKNPLAAIRIMVDTLRARPQDEAFRETFCNVVTEELSRLNRTTREVLDYARPTSLDKCAVRPALLMEAALAALRPELEAASITLVKALPQELPAVFVDGERVKGVFINLLKNAVEAMREGARRELRCTLVRRDAARIEATIEDSGPGIPEAERALLFEPFHTTKKLGTGLGLALCQKVVREHGGTIDAENVPSGGARFRVALPISGS